MRWNALAMLAATLLAASGCLQPLKDAVGLDEPVSHHEALVRSDPYPDLLVEIDYVDGYRPSQLALDALEQTLHAVTDKRTITIAEPSRIPPQGGDYDPQDVLRIHDETLDHPMRHYGHRDAGVLHVLYLDGPSQGNKWQGIYVDDGRGRAVAALLPHHWDDVPLVDLGLPLPRGEISDRLERAVLIHELGHALGLIGGIPEQRPHHQADDAAHSHNPDSVMYTGDVPLAPHTLRAIYETGIDPAWGFDKDDLADLAAFRDA